MRVIQPFLDKKTGKRIKPGDPLPSSISDDRLRKLQRAGCIIIEGVSASLLEDPPVPPVANDSPAPRKRRSRKSSTAVAKEAAAPDSLFPGAGEGASETETGGSESGTACAGAAAVAETDRSDSGARAQLDVAGRTEGAEGADDRGR